MAVRRQETLLFAATTMAGLFWGRRRSFYVPNRPEAILFLVLILVAMTAGPAALLSFHRVAYPAFLASETVPLPRPSPRGCGRCGALRATFTV